MQIAIHLDHSSSTTLQMQIFEQIKAFIRGGQLKPNAHVPSSRELSSQLSVSRNTVAEAYAKLLAEDYLYTEPARGTFVRPIAQTVWSAGKVAERTGNGVVSISAAPQSINKLKGPGLYDPPDPGIVIDFRFGRSDPQFFPQKTWRRLLLECLGGAAERLSQYNDPAGLIELRELIADHLGPARGITATASQVIVVGGFQQGIDLAAHLLVRTDTPVAIEAPCYRGAAFAFESYGGAMVPIAVDAAGIDVADLQTRSVKLVYVTPSHQFPLGVTMSLERRLALLDWAATTGSYILEVDYDSDFRYDGAVLPSLYALDRNNRVIYLNSFSRSLGPGLRLGYIVLPEGLAEKATSLKALVDNGSPWLEQATMAQFIRNGSLDRQLKRVCRANMNKRDAVLSALERHFGKSHVTGFEGGTHMLWRIPEGPASATQLQKRARSFAVGLQPLEEGAVLYHHATAESERSILLGYTHLSEPQIEEGIARIARAFAAEAPCPVAA